jgi:hypothetical protein
MREGVAAADWVSKHCLMPGSRFRADRPRNPQQGATEVGRRVTRKETRGAIHSGALLVVLPLVGRRAARRAYKARVLILCAY